MSKTITKSVPHAAFHNHLRKKGITDKSIHDNGDQLDPAQMDEMMRAFGLDPDQIGQNSEGTDALDGLPSR
jgi:hypothetical protein